MINIDRECKLVQVEDVKPGDTVCFHMPSFNYVVNSVSIGDSVTRHYFGEEDSSNGFERGAWVYVLKSGR